MDRVLSVPVVYTSTAALWFDVKDEPVVFTSDTCNCRVNVFNMGPGSGTCGTIKHQAVEWKEDTGSDKTGLDPAGQVEPSYCPGSTADVGFLLESLCVYKLCVCVCV